MQLEEAKAVMLRLKAEVEDKRFEAVMAEYGLRDDESKAKIKIADLYKRFAAWAAEDENLKSAEDDKLFADSEKLKPAEDEKLKAESEAMLAPQKPKAL